MLLVFCVVLSIMAFKDVARLPQQRTYPKFGEDRRLASVVEAVAKSAVIEMSLFVGKSLITIQGTLASLPQTVACARALSQVGPSLIKRTLRTVSVVTTNNSCKRHMPRGEQRYKVGR